MGHCINHPDTPGTYRCMKHEIDLCEHCLACRDPKIHCRHRPSCMTWFLIRRGGRDMDGKGPE